MESIIRQKTKQFFSQYRPTRFKKNDVLIKAEDTPLGVHFLENGVVRQYSISLQGDEQTLTLYKEGSFFPMTWAVNNTDNRHYFEVSSEEAIIRIAPKEKVVDFIRSNPDVLFDLTKRLLSGVEALLARFEHILFSTAQYKIIHTLTNQSSRFGYKKNEVYHGEMTQKEIVSITGLTKETVSREIKKLKEAGALEYSQKKFILKDIDLDQQM